MHKVKAYFDSCWGHIGVEFPQKELDAPDPDLVTQLFVRGWLIWYRFNRAVSELLKRKGFVLRDSKSDSKREQWHVSS